jgi:hypothetical protein
MQQHEIRACTIHELRAGGGALPTLEGYAAVYDSPSHPIAGLFTEFIDRGAFTRTLADGPDVRALVDHEPSRILGRTKPGTLRLSEDARGLLATIQPGDTSAGRDIVESVRRGDVDQMSFAFSVAEGGQTWETVDGQDVRHLTDVDLHDVSIVTYPAYEATSIQAASRSQHQAYRSQARAGRLAAMQQRQLALGELARAR